MPFFIGVGVITSSILLTKSIKIVGLIVNYGVPIWPILAFILSLLPKLMISILPLSFLIAVLFTFSRLSSDSELTAMEASGLSLLRLTKPVIAMAVVVYLFSIYISLYLLPMGNRESKRLLFDMLKTKTVAGIKEKTFINSFKGLVIYVENVSQSDNTIQGVFISDTRKGDRPTVIFAESGVFITDPETLSISLRLNNGTIHNSIEEKGQYRLASFNRYDFNLNTMSTSRGREEGERNNRELYFNELASKINKKKSLGKDTAADVFDLHERFALPASVFVFTLIGVPLGIHRVRTARYTSFIIALAVAITYYFFYSFLEPLGQGGKINPVLAVWGSDILFGVFGSYIFLKKLKGPSFGIIWWLGKGHRVVEGSSPRGN